MAIPFACRCALGSLLAVWSSVAVGPARAVAAGSVVSAASEAAARSTASNIPTKADGDHHLRLSDFTVVRKGHPSCEQADGNIGLSCVADQAVELYYPHAIRADFTATCRFVASLPKVWINVPQAQVGVFLRPTAPDGTVYPDADKIICSNLTTAWADSGNYQPGAKVGGATGSLSVAYLQQKKEYEFYFRVVKRATTYAVYFSRNGMNWIKLAEDTVSGSYETPYCGVCLSVPAGGRKSGIILKGFDVVNP
jgi:hypothetical protein